MLPHPLHPLTSTQPSVHHSTSSAELSPQAATACVAVRKRAKRATNVMLKSRPKRKEVPKIAVEMFRSFNRCRLVRVERSRRRPWRHLSGRSCHRGSLRRFRSTFNVSGHQLCFFDNPRFYHLVLMSAARQLTPPALVTQC